MRRMLTLLCALLVLVSCSQLAFAKEAATAALQPARQQTVQDMFKVLKNAKILHGEGDGLAHAESTATRAELAVAIFQVFHLQNLLVNANANPYTDIARHWAEEAILCTTQHQFLTAAPGAFSPNHPATDEQFARALLAGLRGSAAANDSNALKDAYEQGLLRSDQDGPLSRADLIYGLYQVYYRNMSSIAAGTLEPSLSLQAASQGETFTFAVKNQTEQPVKLTFNSTQRYDYQIYDQNGQLVEQYSSGRMFGFVVSSQTLKQGEALTYSGTFKVAKPGAYKVKFWLTSDYVKPIEIVSHFTIR